MNTEKIVEVPTLETERLLLRAFRPDDFEPFADFYADAERSKFVGGPAKRNQAWLILASEIGHWTLRGYGMWALEEKSSGAFVGCCGLWCPDGWPEQEVGYWLVGAHEGKGFATEAARRARAHAYEDRGWTTLISCIAEQNMASKKVAARLGAVYEGRVELPVGLAEVYRHPGPASLA